MRITREEIMHSAEYMPGDLLLFSYPGGLVPRGIAHVQKGLLLDLGCEDDTAEYGSSFTHVGMYGTKILDEEGKPMAENGFIVEMTSPHARIGNWDEVPSGTVVLVRRPGSWVGGEWRDADEFKRVIAVQQGILDAVDSIPYPYTELLTYWVWHLWIGKLKLGRKFRNIFRDRKRDVCSGSVWRWMYDAGLNRDTEGMTDSLPEAWYPGRLAVDSTRFRTVVTFSLDG